MSNNTLPATTRTRLPATTEARQFVSITIGKQSFGIPVLLVHDVLGPQRITRIPLAPKEVAGSLNLRGRIVTAIQVRRRLGLDPLPADAETMSVVVEHQGELYSLIVDGVGEVLTLYDYDFESHPPTMSSRVREVSTGIYRLKDTLLVVLDVPSLLDFVRVEAA
ncbi:chemotaxis protein CheW [Thalassobaculum fulvum]|jgi:purine-binding chemotaxis protein CheW|uniref:Chemotaxis protein CheW n=1 Tax=Thalassobaculum fulvum TaxID=1633335 RepID=A0A918XW91_9PROT|nr:chemotaxis protein CheW [Thalassobaculum fulvum]GHD60812.1 chemotaxis protein CheW [Thalassobaculum fulvum]